MSAYDQYLNDTAGRSSAGTPVVPPAIPSAPEKVASPETPATSAYAQFQQETSGGGVTPKTAGAPALKAEPSIGIMKNVERKVMSFDAGFTESVGQLMRSFQWAGDRLVGDYVTQKDSQKRLAEDLATNKVQVDQIVALIRKQRAEGKDPSHLEEVLKNMKINPADYPMTADTTTGLFYKAQDKTKEWADILRKSAGITPENQTFTEKIFEGAGSSATYFIPALGTAKYAGALARVSPTMAMIFGGSASAGLESMAEAGQVYDEVKKKDGAQEAMIQSNKTFLANAVLLGLTERLGVFNPEVKGVLKKALISMPTEGFQEATQQLIQNINTGKNPWDGVLESGVIGGIIGGVMGAGVDLTTSRPVQLGKDIGAGTTPAETPAQTPQAPVGASIDLQKRLEAGLPPEVAQVSPEAPIAPATPTETPTTPTQAPTQAPATPQVENLVAKIQQSEPLTALQEAVHTSDTLESFTKSISTNLEKIIPQGTDITTFLHTNGFASLDEFYKTVKNNPTLNTPSTATGSEIAQKIKSIGSDQGGISDWLQNEIAKEDYKKETVTIDELIKNDADLKEYIDGNKGKVRKFKGEAFAMDPIVSSTGSVHDGYNRIAQAIKDGKTSITILKGIAPKTPALPAIEKISKEDLAKLHEDLRNEYRKVGHIKDEPDFLKADENLSYMAIEMDLAKAGERLFTPDGVVGVPSTFPQWIDEANRSKALFEKVFGTLEVSKLEYPSRSTSDRQRSIYNDILDQLDARLGVDTSIIRNKILQSYERGNKKETTKRNKRGTDGGAVRGTGKLKGATIEEVGQASKGAYRETPKAPESHNVLPDSIPRTDIIGIDPIINLKKEVPVKDIHGVKSVIPEGEALTPYILKGGNILLKDGVETMISKNQYQNVLGNAKKLVAKEFAPELKQTEESVKGQSFKDAYNKADALMASLQEKYKTTSRGDTLRAMSSEDRAKFTKAQEEASALTEEATKFSNYQMPDGKKYQEILIKAPPATGITFEEVNGEFKAYKDGKMFGVFSSKQKALDTLGTNFKSSHWDEPNVIAHLRMNEREYKGKKVLFMEELQSDWARESRTGKTPATNPLLKNWQELAIKRALKEAVASNAKYFAWINGEQTSARYNLSTQLDNVKWKTAGSTTAPEKQISLKVKSGSNMEIGIDNNGIVTFESSGKGWKGKKLDEVIGKGLADKIMADEKGTLAGEGLKFGGEWASTLYDKQVANIVKDLTGAKIMTMDLGLPIHTRDGEFFGNEMLPSGKYPRITKSEELKVGMDIRKNFDHYIITNVLENGKFEAMPKEHFDSFAESKGLTVTGEDLVVYAEHHATKNFWGSKQTFDISTETVAQQGIEITPEIRSIILGQTPEIKKPSGVAPTVKPKVVTETAGASGAGKASIGLYRDDTQVIINASALKPIQFPELIDISRELMGNTPFIRKYTKANGMFYGRGGGEIGLHPDLFKQENLGQLQKTLAHEIGHLIDYLPTQTMTRGNLAGRLNTLRDFRKDFFAPMGVSRTDKELREQMWALSKYWRPVDEATASASHLAYRKGSDEIYADFISALFNDPRLTADMAPTAYNVFFEKLDAKPKVKEAYFGLQDLLRYGDVIAKRRSATQKMFKTTEQSARERQIQDQVEKEANEKSIWFKFKTQAVDITEAVREKVKEAEKKGVRINDDDNPNYYLEQRNYLGGKIKAEVDEKFNGIYLELQKNDLAWEDLGELMFYERVLKGDRQDIANPLGYQPDFVRELYDVYEDVGTVKPDQAQYEKGTGDMRSTLGDEKFNILKSLAEKYRANLKSFFEQGRAEGIYNADLAQMFTDNAFYVPFKGAKYSGVTKTAFTVKHQKGTLGDIENPANTGIEKAVSIIRAMERNKVARKTMDFLQANFADEVQEAKLDKNGYPIDPREADLGLVTYMQDGKVKGFYVDKYIAESIQKKTVADMNVGVEVLKYFNSGLFRPLFITFNLGFQSFNLIRDFKRFWKNVPNMTILKAVKLYAKSARGAKIRAFGLPENPSPADIEAYNLINRLEREQVLSITFNDVIKGEAIEDKQIERILREVGIREAEKTKLGNLAERIGVNAKTPVIREIRGLLDTIESMGNLIETLPKVAGLYAMEGTMPPMEMRSYLRKYVGSPDFLAGGKFKPYMNEVFLFSNAIFHGIRSDYEIAVAPKSRGAYWMKTAQSELVPKMLMMMAVAGLFGDWMKEMFANVSEYDKTNYGIIPLGIDQNGKTIYVRLPSDETGRLIGGLFWKTMSAIKDPDKLAQMETYTNILAYAGGQVPSITPVVTAGMNATQFLAGNNPYDFFRGRPVLTDQQQQAGGTERLKPFLSYMFEQLGGGVFLKLYSNETVPRNPSLSEKVVALPVLSNIAGRFVRVSDYGQKEILRNISNEVKTEQARESLQNRRIVFDYVDNARGKSPAEANMMKHQMVNEIFNGVPKTQQDRTKAQSLIKRFDTLLLRGSADARVDSLITAQSNDEKVALLKQYKKTMSVTDFEDLKKFVIQKRVVSPQAFQMFAQSVDK